MEMQQQQKSPLPEKKIQIPLKLRILFLQFCFLEELVSIDWYQLL